MCMYPQTIPAWTTIPFPLRLDRKKTKAIDKNVTIQVPCGKCPDCKRLRAIQWSFRLQQEQHKSINGGFITLTYNEENIPYLENGVETLDYDDLTKFIKKLRRQTEYFYSKGLPDYKAKGSNKHKYINTFNALKSTKIKYYAVGEYGGNTNRPHYHLIAFNIPREVKEKIGKIWSKGMVKVGTVTPKSIRYVANYIMINKQSDDVRVPESARMSKGIGLGYFENNESYMRRRISSTIRYNDIDIPMPKYYKDKVFNEEEKAFLGEKNKNEYFSKELERREQWIKQGKDPEEEIKKINKEKIRKFLKNKKARL